MLEETELRHKDREGYLEKELDEKNREYEETLKEL